MHNLLRTILNVMRILEKSAIGLNIYLLF